MQSVKRNRSAHAHRHVARGLVLAVAVSAGGCSADVTRFDFPAFNLNEKGSTTGSLQAAQEPFARGGYDEGSALAPPRGVGLASDDGRASQPAQPAYSAPYSPTGERTASLQRDYSSAPLANEAPAAERPASKAVERASPPDRRNQPPRILASGETAQVQQGDSLYGIAKRHGVPVSALIEVNGLKHGSTIKPGQELKLPAVATPPRRAEPIAIPHAAPSTVVATQPAAHASTQAPQGAIWEGRYTMRSGDSLYAIAHQHKVSLSDLQRANNISDPTKVRAGTILQVPGAAEPMMEPRVAERRAEADAAPAAPPRVVQNSGPATAGQPHLLNGAADTAAEPVAQPTRVATRTDTAMDAAQPAASARFRWPVTGRVIAPFGKRPDGTHNDGINIAVPQGTEIHAAEGGTVAYAGNELKGYGNLILIRHDNGWVSAYAHNDSMLVKHDDVIRRGQVIARAGRTGTVDQPQVHFELRQGAKPVDPLPYMERN
jgi:murein DD-endopeptidase MepM/ murein hydrolase activator NlpD